MTYDEAALPMLLSGDTDGLKALCDKAEADLTGYVECPECGDEGPHDDNGRVGPERTFCCDGCGSHFDAEEVGFDA